MADSNPPSKGRKIGFWIATSFIGFIMGASGLADIVATDEVVAMFTVIGYPAYIVRFIGVAKLLGAITILVPRFPRLKEWAYAGIVIDLLGAGYSHISNGDGPDKFVPPLLFLTIALASYFSRPDERKLPDAPP